MALSDFTGSINTGGNSNGGNSSNSGGPNIPMSPFASFQSDDFDPEEIMTNYNAKFAGEDPILFRDEIINQTVSILISKNKPNAILTGMAGVGKTKIVEDIARRIENQDPRIPKNLIGYTIWDLPLSNIVEGTGIQGQLETKVKDILTFASDPANKVILFIDEIHQLINDRHASYSTISQLLKPALARGDIKVIGATTSQEYQNLQDDPAFNRRFSKVIVDELSQEQTEEILKNLVPSFTLHYKNVSISDQVIEQVVKISDRYKRAGNHRPDTAITLLDRAIGDAIVCRKELEYTNKDNPNLLSAIQANPIITLTEKQLKQTAIKLMTGHAKKNEINKDALLQVLKPIKGQDRIITEVVNTIVKDSRNLFPRKAPLSILFAGKSGVGKTEVSKIIADYVTGQKPIILNMTEYHSETSINRIIGSDAGYVSSDSKRELPFDILETNPYQIILLDEFEKADKAVQRLFMSAFDEGYIKTSKGKIVDFSKAIIIATTNASHTTASSDKIGFFSSENDDNKTAEIVDELKNWFDEELLNRFTKIVTFNELSYDNYKEILADIYEREAKRIKEDFPRIILDDVLDEDTLETLAKKSYVSAFGARPAFKTIKEHIEEVAIY